MGTDSAGRPDSSGRASDDPISALEVELADFWRRNRSRARTRTHAMDPRLDPSTYPLLTIVGRSESVPMSTLVAKLALDKSTVTRQIDAVVRLGLVERRPDPNDARARVVSLTPLGRERFESVVASAVDEWRRRLSQWNPDDIRTLTDLLKRLAESSDAVERASRDEAR